MLPNSQSILIACAVTLGLAAGATAQHQHGGDFMIGASGGPAGQLKFEINEEILSGAIVLSADAFGGYSTDSPGFDRMGEDEPDENIYRLAAGAQIWLQIHGDSASPALGELMISPALFIYDSALFAFFPYQEGSTLYREVYLGTHQVHKHVSWFVDATDPAFDAGQCVWEVTCRLIDKGTTSYSPSEPFTLQFSLHALVPGDFDCDRDVDADDLALFEGCHNGPAIPLDESCRKFDLDSDGDADSTDFAIIQRCWSGPGVPGDPNCAG